MPFWIWLILGFVLLSFLGMFAATWPIAKKVYHNILVRTGPEKWTRANSYPPNPEHSRMFDLGMDWARENEARKRPVSIENEGLKLAGEYFDFGHKRCAIIFPGRTESLYYSYYFAQPYADPRRRQPCPRPERRQIQLLQHTRVVGRYRMVALRARSARLQRRGAARHLRRRRRRRAGSRKAGLSGLCLPSRG